MSDGLFASSLHNNIISWEVSASIDGDYSASFSLSNEEGQYDASIIPAIYSSDNHLLQRACAINWSPVEAFLDVKLVDVSNAGGITSLIPTDLHTASTNAPPSTIPDTKLQAGGARRHVFGLVESHGRAENDRSNELSLDIVSFTSRLRKKDLTDFVTTGSTVKVAIEQVLDDIATLHTSLWDTSACPTEDFVGFIDGDNIIECVRKLAQVAGADVFTNEFGILVVEPWKDHTSSIDYVIPDGMIRTVSKEIPIGDAPSVVTVAGKDIEEADGPAESTDATDESVNADTEQEQNCGGSGDASNTDQGDANDGGVQEITIKGNRASEEFSITDRDSLFSYMSTLQNGPYLDETVGVPVMHTNPFEAVGRGGVGESRKRMIIPVREIPQKTIALADRKVIEYENLLYAYQYGCVPNCGTVGNSQSAAAGDAGAPFRVWDHCMLELMNQNEPSKFISAEPGEEEDHPGFGRTEECNDDDLPYPTGGNRLVLDNAANTAHLSDDNKFKGRDDIHPGMAIQPYNQPWRLNGTIVVKANEAFEGFGGNNRYANGMRNCVQFHYLPFDPVTGSGGTEFLNHYANVNNQTTGCFVDVIGQQVDVYYTGWCQVIEVVDAINAHWKAQKLVVVEHGREYDSSEWLCNEAHGGQFSDYPSVENSDYVSDGSGFMPTRQGGLQFDPYRVKAMCREGNDPRVARGDGMTGDGAGFPNNYFSATAFSSPIYFCDDPEEVTEDQIRKIAFDVKAPGGFDPSRVLIEETAPRQKVITGRDAWTIRNMSEILSKQNELAEQLKALEDKVQEEADAEAQDQSGKSAGGGTGQSAQPHVSAEEALMKTREALRESGGIIQPGSGSGQRGGHEKDSGLQTHEHPTKIQGTAHDSFLRDQFGYVGQEFTNEFIAHRHQCTKIAARVLQEAKMNRRRYSIDMMYSPKVGLNRVVRFNTPYSAEEVTGRVVSISIAYDKSPAATMSITVESFEDLGKTSASSNILGNPALRQLDGKNWKSEATEAAQARVLSATDLTFLENGINSTSTDFLAAGFMPKQWVSVEGSTSRYNNSDKCIHTVTANNITWRLNDTGELTSANDHDTNDAIDGINIYSVNIPYQKKQEARIDDGYITLQTFDSTYRGHVLDRLAGDDGQADYGYNRPRGDCPGGTAELWQEIKLQAGFYRLLFNARDDMISGGFDNLEFHVDSSTGGLTIGLVDTWTHNDLNSDPRAPSSMKQRSNISSTFTISEAKKYKLRFKTSRTGGISTGVGNRIQISNVRLFTETTI